MKVGGAQKTRKVTVADYFHIPDLSEALVNVYMERTEDGDQDQNPDFLAEPCENKLTIQRRYVNNADKGRRCQ